MKEEFVFGQLMVNDVLVAVIFFIVRGLMDLYLSHEKVIKRNEVWSTQRFLNKNIFRYALSWMAAIGLMIALPEGITFVSSDLFDKQFTWNVFYSGVIGYAPIELFLYIKKKLKKRALELDEKV